MPEFVNCLCRAHFAYTRRSFTMVLLAISLLNTGALAKEFNPALKAHAKPRPYKVIPLYDVHQAGGEMPLVQTQADPIPGAVDTFVSSSAQNVRVGSSYNSATDGQETFADVRAKGSKFYGRAIVVDESADSYKGASGKEQRFGYDRQAGQLLLGMKPRGSTNVKLVYIRDLIEDNKVPTVVPAAYNNGELKVARGFGVDPIDTDRQITKLMWDEKFNYAFVQDLHLALYSIELDRTADNFSLRDDTATAKRLRAKVDRKIYGVKLNSDVAVDSTVINIALDYTNINHDAKRYGGPTTAGLESVSAYQYPGVELGEWVLSARSEVDLTTQQKLTFGLSYKYVDANATKATLTTDTPNTGNLSALALYQTYYGSGIKLQQSEGHLGGKLQWNYDSPSHFTAYTSLASAYRSPDTQERYFAVASLAPTNSSPMGPNARAVGNPEIDWEQHRIVEAGVAQSSDSWQINMKAYYDDVNDFITRDRARGQTVTEVSDYARIWRNVDAVLAGLTVDAKANLTTNMASRIALNLSWGENSTDDRDLYGIAPFEANWFLDYFDTLNTGAAWNVGAQVRYVAKHDNIDSDPTSGSGFDAEEADDFSTINLYASVQIWERIGMKVGVNNLTDESYYDAMAKYPLDGNPYLVEAPERNFYVMLAASF